MYGLVTSVFWQEYVPPIFLVQPSAVLFSLYIIDIIEIDWYDFGGCTSKTIL